MDFSSDRLLFIFLACLLGKEKNGKARATCLLLHNTYAKEAKADADADAEAEAEAGAKAKAESEHEPGPKRSRDDQVTKSKPAKMPESMCENKQKIVKTCFSFGFSFGFLVKAAQLLS